MASSNAGSKSLKEYLKRYESNHEEENKKKKKKKKVKPDATGVRVLDEDPVWQKPVQLEEEDDNDSADEEKPQVNEDIEVKRMKRLEQLRARRAYNAIAEDGSGWVSLSPNHANSANPNSDISPPRRQRTRNDTPSPEPQEIPLDPGREDTDLSPPRQRERRHHTPSELETKFEQFNDPNSDLSPPRKRRSQKDTPSPEPEFKPSREDQMPSHLIGQNADISPPRRRRAQTSENFDRRKSPFQRAHPNSPQQDDACPSPGSDLSPPRKSRKESSDTASIKKRKGGLFTRSDIGEDNSRTKRNDLMSFQQMDPSITGRGAEAVYRDKKTGRSMSKDEYLKLKQKVEEKPKLLQQEKLEWGKGLAQKREAEARMQELELEKDMPFARTRDDPELDKMLKERLRWGDPMAHLVKKKYSEPVLSDLGDNEKMKESGFIIPQDIPNHSWIRRGLDAAPNRYGIKPGRHWDGVDRSNGFEKQLFKRSNEKQATEREAYLWSVSDM